jgi:lysophospholipase L1-like esterase
VVLGDSLAEGRDDPDPAGGWLGWVGRLAGNLDLTRDRVANLGGAGATVAEVARVQLPEVRHLTPGLVVLNCGMNDVINGFDRAEAAGHLGEIFGWIRSAGAVGVAAPVSRPPLLERSIISDFRRKRVLERIQVFNAELRQSARVHAMEFIEPDAAPRVADPSLWAFDGIHLNSAGHAYVAEIITGIVRNLLGEHVLSTSG